MPEPVHSLLPLMRRLLGARDLFADDSLAVLAISGGPDSLCLLHCFASLREILPVGLHVAHVQHGLRGSDAEADAAFVAAQSAAYGLPCTILRLDPQAFRGGSLQETARRARYAAVRSLAATLGGGCIVTAHTEDDQAETVLLHLLRGSGIDGLSGMRYRQGDLVRPLLGVSRAAVEAHCAAHGLTPRHDASNRNRKYRRNALRLDVLPVLERFNPAIRPSLARTAASLSRDAEYLRAQAEAALAPMVLNSSRSGLVLDRAAYSAQHPAIRLHALRAALERLGGTAGWTLAHLEAVDALATSGRAGRRWELPHGVRAEASGDRLMLSVGVAHAQAKEPVTLRVPGAAWFGAWLIKAELLPGPVARGRLGSGDRRELWCDPAIVGDVLQVRSRRPGDRLRPLGLDGTKKLQDLFVDRKVPRGARDAVPIVTGARGIIWVVDLAVAADAVLARSAGTALRLSARREACNGPEST